VKIGPAEIGLAKIGPAKIGLAKIGPAKIGPVKIGLAEIGSNQIGFAKTGRFHHEVVAPYALDTNFHVLSFQKFTKAGA